MSTIGTGNFDNDDAMDYLGEIIELLSERVDEILADKTRRRLDEEGEGRLMPSVELIALLCERYNTATPREKTVHKWREKYLKVFDNEIDGLTPAPRPGYKEERRKTIEKTFEWLESLSRTFWEDA